MATHFIGKAKLTKQGQITLPKEGRDDLHIKDEEELFWYRVDDCLLVTTELYSIDDIEKHLRKKPKKRV